ncbi:phage tail fiber protein [Klebsiella pneumoniae]|uniref:phage tail fiber domain-containing protein n=1 Tax=Klebsiella pneumoniae TaxID=573 RepID=UPI001D0ED875|nr:phage tail fiber protein [Klebsiella pneumoniae]
MTVSTQVSRNEYTGNGATTQYDFTFRILDKSHLLVQTLDTSESIVTLTLGTDYTVTGVNRYNGGKVVLTSALPAGYKISIERSTPVTQEASIRNQGGFFPEIHEDALDKLTMLVQQAYGWWSGLSLRKPSWLANYYDALNNRIRNLRDPSQAQDAATKNYVDGQIVDNTNAWKAGDAVLDNKIDANFARTLRVPDVSVDMLPSAMYRKGKVHTYDAATGQPLLIDAGQLSVGDILNLSSSDGFKYIGKCKSVASLRTIEPTISGQSIILERAVIGGPLLNVILTHNPAASDAVDDGYSRFVTTGGAVWDADISFGHNVFLAGYSDELNNLADCLNMIIQDKVNKVISRGYVAGGVDAEIRIPPNPNAEGMTDFYMNKKSVKIPSFLRVYSAPGAIYDYSDFTTGVGIIGSNEFEGLTNDMMYRNNGGGWGAGAGASNSHNSGGFIGNGCLIKGPNTTSNPNATTYPGVRWGNVTYPGGDQAHFRDSTFSDARVSGWGSGFRPGSVNTYLMDVVACHFTNNTYGIDTYTAWSGSTPQWANSGEKMSFRGCLIGNNRSHAVYLDNRGDFFYFDMCSIDYNGGDVFHCSPTNLGEVNYINGHIEGNSGLILNCPTRTTNDGENNVKIRGAKIYPNKSTNDKYGGVFGTTIRTILELDSCNIFCRAPYVNGAYPTWKSYNPANLARLIIKYPGSGQTYRFLPSYDGAYGYRINDKLLFSGTENENVPTSRTGDFWCIKSGGASCVYGGAGDADSDGVIPIKITLNSPTDTVQLLFSRQITPERGTQHIHGFCSIKAAAFAGALNVSAIARTVASVTRTANTTTGVITETENLYGVNQSISQDILTSLANSTISITKDDYMGTRPLAVQLIGGNYSYLGFLFTGGTGTFYVKLPVWANLDSHPTIGYQ